MPITRPWRTRFSLSILAGFTYGLSYGLQALEPAPTHQHSPVQNLKTLFAKPLPTTMAERLEYFSRALLGQPYLLGALGEGENGVYDTSPLYRFDGFDCETFVDTVLALALSHNAETFAQCINRIRYKNGIVNFTTRNHFASLDWNLNNQEQYFLKDISKTFRDAQGKPVYKIARARIDKSAWYQKLPLSRLRIATEDKTILRSKLKALHQEGQHFNVVEAILPYIPLTALFNTKGQANTALFQQIPNGAIVEIVRPNWDLTDAIGTHLNVSHLGFVFWQGQRAIFREASSVHHKTIDVDLIAYLREYLDSPTVKGINIQVVLPKTPLSPTCSVSTTQNTNQSQ